MPKVVSNEQRLANRQNAQQSTGPRTAEGKARSSKNALKHGLLASDVVITTGPTAEDPADFQALLTDYQRELKPKDRIQQTLVERLAVCDWRLRRAHRFEVRAHLAALENAAPPDADPVALDKLRRALKQPVADLKEDEYFLKRLQIPPDPSNADATAEFQTLLQHLAKNVGLDPANRPPDDLRNTLVELLEDSAERCRAAVTKLKERLADARRRAELSRSRAEAESLLPDQSAILRLVRYESMLDRQFHRALAELCRRKAKTPLPPKEWGRRVRPTRKTKK